ncbi:MAG TPA: enoyl-CoA hydratase-related protein [Acidimicrobiales bacterium]|nr:enoyl-CoA hydratase-related protein [Acidimicrobiales bacterium]
MDYEQILYEVADPVATITLNRPEFLNAWTNQMGVEVKHAVAQAERDRNVVGIVLTGAGRGFCAGADMKMLSGISGGGAGPADAEGTAPASVSAEDIEAGDPSWGDDLRGTYTYLMSVPKPIIAAINGPIAGMAVPIALACDLRFMANDAVLTIAFSQRGLIAEWGVGWLLPRLIGTGAALDLLFSSRKANGVECERLGLVNRAVDGDVVKVAREYIEELAARCSPTSMAIMKKQVYQQLHAGLGPKEREAQQFMVESFSRPDFAEGVQSFLDKRPPDFQRLPVDG